MDILGRFAEPSLLILVSLADGSKHGYAIMQDIEQTMAQRLGPGTLYGAIARLESAGLIEAIKSHDRRQPYRLTPAGLTALRDHMETLQRFTQVAAVRLSNI
ncbi:MAG: helix-turn-helix transcriptional regulator [Burkholderiales bacterium]|nr:helix-turn-helix transcriptional regulator [Anaerolineae bacterium]